ncbi:Hypothetical predicted protein [Pelobates cultripes]|uniref:Uncharacterized protein n=1 Tax=Pelobates cultripes TaxID=61616 RepID=A0AAD1TJ21_PELCU|nr:Hypothetical predicted protein [Pelobates cultripes]
MIRRSQKPPLEPPSGARDIRTLLQKRPPTKMAGMAERTPTEVQTDHRLLDSPPEQAHKPPQGTQMAGNRPPAQHMYRGTRAGDPINIFRSSEDDQH